MAAIVTASLEATVVEGGATRWQGRASSIAEVEAQLTRIWTSAAEEVAHTPMSEAERSRAMGDPRLAHMLDAPEDVRVRTRTSVLTLVVVAPRPETTERAIDAVNLLAGRHPSRAIILSPGDPDGPPTLDARIVASCHVSGRGDSETCTEQIHLRVGGETAQHLSAVVAPLLIHDLPVVLWWPDEPPIGRRPFRELLETVDRLLVDSGSFGADGSRRLAGLAAVIAEGDAVVHDIGWMRLTLWRELLAGLFDHPLLQRETGRCKAIRIHIARPSGDFRTIKGALFVGWLAGQLDWEIAQPLASKSGSDSLFATLREGKHDIRVEFRPATGTAGEASVRSAGSLTRVELELGRGTSAIRAVVTRQQDHLLATAEWNGAPIIRRPGRLEAFGEAPYLGEALDLTGQDRVFERALARATRLIGG
ncbi:MAG: glucose-6-phosphate dehydrogenase assembly protein OpcA [Chloroflexi bacterium]|nr:glucose-6-phosphate dehydrogenase assembly protein OpcA [Chloroflexota bacterium]